MLVNTKHFHFGKNQLSGKIPSQLFSSTMTLIHVLFESNQLSSSIPSTLGLVQTLEALRLDRNSLSGSVPSSFDNLINVNELHLSNNQLTGPWPNLTGMDFLNYLDMSNNTFDGSNFPPRFSTLQSLTTFVLRNNQLNGTLDVGSGYSNQLQLIDLQNNSIGFYTYSREIKVDLILVGNPVCEGAGVTQTYCIPQRSNSSDTTPRKNCMPSSCKSDQILGPNCTCAYPYMGALFFRAPSFSDLGNSSIYTSLGNSLMNSFLSDQLPVDSVYLSNPTTNTDEYFVLRLEVFPSGLDHFNRTGISGIGFTLTNQTFKPPRNFGPFYFIADQYLNFAESAGAKKSSTTGKMIRALVGSSVGLLSLLAGIYAFCLQRVAERLCLILGT